MEVDEDLLRQARRAAARFADAQHEAERAKAEYHQAVRRLHMVGAPMREIADALKVSHQRVHQIIEASGGSRGWRSSKRAADELACTFCERGKDEVTRLIAGPGVFICDGCVRTALRVGEDRGPRRVGTNVLDVAGGSGKLTCSFCGKQARSVRWLVATGADARICDECLRLCDEIIVAGLDS